MGGETGPKITNPIDNGNFAELVERGQQQRQPKRGSQG
jgi:hypothetical protein